MKIELFVSFPPSINNYYVKTRNGLFISKVGRAYRAEVISTIAEIIGPISGHFPLSTPVSVSVVYYPMDRRKRDLDNYKKALYDAITHSGLWLDDSLIDQEFIYRGSIVKPAGLVWMLIDTDSLPIITNHEDKRKFGRDWVRYSNE